MKNKILSHIIFLNKKIRTKDKIQKTIEFIRKNILRVFVFVIFLLLFVYISDDSFRVSLKEKNIDPNFIIGFLTMMALLFSLIQSSYDKKFSYNMKLIDSLQDKGLRIIGKLLTIKHKSEMWSIGLKEYKKSIEVGQIYIDSNESLSKKDIDDNLELISAYVQTLFPEECLEWNELIEKMNTLGTYNCNIVLNYNENILLIKEQKPFTNDSLNKIDFYIKEAEKINGEIDNLALNMIEKIVSKINDNTKKVKDSFYFNI